MLKSKRRLITVFVILGVFASLLILGSALFSIREITVEFYSYGDELKTYNKEQILVVGDFPYGKNILFEKFDKNKTNIEQNFPYAKVLKVERKFPNQLIVYLMERTPAFKVVYGGKICVLDEDLKILKVASVEEDLTLNEKRLPVFEDVAIQNAKSGQFVQNDELESIIKDIVRAVSDDDVRLSMNIFTNIKKTTLPGQNDEFCLKLEDGVTINIAGSNNFAIKVLGALNLYQKQIANDELHYPNKNDVTITVNSNYTGTQDSEISASGYVS